MYEFVNNMGKTIEKKGKTTIRLIRARIVTVLRMEEDLSSLIAKIHEQGKQKYLTNIYQFIHIKVRNIQLLQSLFLQLVRWS